MAQTGDNIDGRREEECSGPDCSEVVHPTNALTIAWTNGLFCSRECKSRWRNANTGYGGLDL